MDREKGPEPWQIGGVASRMTRGTCALCRCQEQSAHQWCNALRPASTMKTDVVHHDWPVAREILAPLPCHASLLLCPAHSQESRHSGEGGGRVTWCCPGKIVGQLMGQPSCHTQALCVPPARVETVLQVDDTEVARTSGRRGSAATGHPLGVERWHARTGNRRDWITVVPVLGE